MLAITIFCLSYFGIALGKIPGLIVDRVGVALLGAIAMVVFGVVTIEGAVGSINLPTILLLYSLMIISAQLRLGGFYTWTALKIVPYYTHPRLFLLITMLVSALLSALLAPARNRRNSSDVSIAADIVLLDFNRMIYKLPNNGIEMDFKKLPLLKTTYTQI